MAGTRPSRLPALLVLLALVACGGRDAEGSPADSAATTADPAAAAAAPDRSPGAARGGADSLAVTIDGRRFAGTHRVGGAMGCVMYGGTWQATYEDMNASGLSGMMVQIKAVPAAGGSTDQVRHTVVFGQMDDMSGTAGMLDLVGAEYAGDARATVTREGAGAVIRVEGTAQEGLRVTTVLRCASVELLR